MSKLSYGINIPKKPTSNFRPAPVKRKTIFDDEDDEDGDDLSSLGGGSGLQTSTVSSKSSKPISSKTPPKTTASLNKINDDGIKTKNLSAARTATLHAKTAESLDPSIYDYDGIYESLHAQPKAPAASDPSATSKPKYMTSLHTAAEQRKRDLLRAKEKLLAREREAEGDAFADKETFVTGAYKRQQEQLRKEEEEEKRKDEEARQRRIDGGGGMRELYKGMLDQGEERHQAVLKAVEESKVKPNDSNAGQGDDVGKAGKEKKQKSEVDMAKEKGLVVNEDGEIVDKRQLLSAGLNAASGAARAKKVKPPPARPHTNAGGGSGGREGDSRAFEDQLLGKHAFDSDDDDDNDDARDGGGGGGGGRAAKSRKMEDALLAGFGSP